ncbi:MAG: protein kinase [Polyangiaceae bacterium]|nr:protein kinase [Polyangiaceae bacterium]
MGTLTANRRTKASPTSSADDVVLDDPRWEALAAGEATPEDVAQLRAWSERSVTAKAAWEALQPVTKTRLDELTTRALREVEARKQSRAEGHGSEILGGKYRLLERHSQGVWESIWEAENIISGRPVVIKSAHGEELIRQMQQETRYLQRISHPNVLTLLDSGETSEGSFYIVTERLDGENLREILKEKRRLDLAQALRITRQVASALEAVHAAGLIHRDISSSTIFLHRTESGFVAKLMGFARCKDMRSSSHLEDRFTFKAFRYPSPEQLKDPRRVTELTDIWSLGILIYEMLTGERPFRAPDVAEVMRQIMTKSVPPPSLIRPTLPTSWDELVLRCTARAPEERFQTVGNVLAMLSTIESELCERTTAARAFPPESVPPQNAEPLQYDDAIIENTSPLPSHPYRRARTQPMIEALQPTVEPPNQEAQLPPKVEDVPKKPDVLRRNSFIIANIAVFVVVVVTLVALESAPSQLQTYALVVESILLMCMAIGTERLYRRLRKTEAALTETRGKLQPTLHRIQSLEADNKRRIGWLDTTDQELNWYRNELQKRPILERKTYRILTIGVKGTGKTSLTLKWVNPLVDLGTIEGTMVERYERTVSQVRTRDRLVEHVFEVYDWPGAHIVDAQQELLTVEIHGILMVVDLGGKDARQIDQHRIVEQLDEFNPQTLKFFLSAQTITSCKTVVLFINKSDLFPGSLDDAEAHAKALYAPLIESLMQYETQLDVKVFVGSARNGHSLHHLFGHLVEQILPTSAYDAQLLQRLEGSER